MNDCHARMSVTRCVFNMPHVRDSRMSFGRGCGKASTTSGVDWWSTLILIASGLCGIFMIVSIETGGPRIAWDPW